MRNPVHPGAILREEALVELDVSVTEVAARLGVSRIALSRVLHEHVRVAPSLAVPLEAAGVGTARAWLAMQTPHDLTEERATGTPKVRRLDTLA